MDEGGEEAEVDEQANASDCDVESAGALLSVDCRRRPCPSPRAPRCGRSGRAPLPPLHRWGLFSSTRLKGDRALVFSCASLARRSVFRVFTDTLAIHNRPKTVFKKREINSLNGGSSAKLLAADCLLLGVGSSKAPKHSLEDAPFIFSQDLRTDKPCINWGKLDDSACVDTFVPAVPKFKLHWLVVNICGFSSPGSIDTGIQSACHKRIIDLKGAGVGTGHKLRMGYWTIIRHVANKESFRYINHRREM